MFGYIYKTTNLINNKYYIGQHKSSSYDSNYKGSGKLIRKAFEKYGFENFKCEVLHVCYSQAEMDEKEVFYIKEYNARDSSVGYNIAYGGCGGGHPLSEEAKEKLKIHHANPEYRKHMSFLKKGKPSYIRSEETRKKLGAGGKKQIGRRYYNNGIINIKIYEGSNVPEGFVKGKLLSEEQRKKLSERMKNKIVSIETRIKMSKIHKGKKLSKEHIECIINANIGRTVSEESKKKVKETKLKKYGGYFSKEGYERLKQNPKKMIGKIWINNGKIQTLILPEKFEEYKNKGFIKGMLKK